MRERRQIIIIIVIIREQVVWNLEAELHKWSRNNKERKIKSERVKNNTEEGKGNVIGPLMFASHFA